MVSKSRHREQQGGLSAKGHGRQQETGDSLNHPELTRSSAFLLELLTASLAVIKHDSN